MIIELLLGLGVLFELCILGQLYELNQNSQIFKYEVEVKKKR